MVYPTVMLQRPESLKHSVGFSTKPPFLVLSLLITNTNVRWRRFCGNPGEREGLLSVDRPSKAWK